MLKDFYIYNDYERHRVRRIIVLLSGINYDVIFNSLILLMFEETY